MVQKYKQLINAIHAVLLEGIRLNPAVVHCLDSMSGINTPQALEQILSGPLDYETDTLCELVFFPDDFQRIRLEPVIEAAGLDEDDLEPVIDILWRVSGPIPIFFPGNRGVCRAAIPFSAISQFVRRLNITRTADPGISDAIRAIGEAELSCKLKVILRNARFEFSGNIVGFLRKLMLSIETAAPDFQNLFAFACELLEQTGPDDDIFDCLMVRRRHWAEMIRQSRDSDLQITAQPVEVLMMKGTNVFITDVEATRRHIDLIDRISLAVYGRIDPPDDQIDLGNFEGSGGDIEKLIRTLS